MTSRRTGVLTALLLTAALFLYLPGMLKTLIPADSNRMHESLRPPRMHTLTVWLLPGETDDRRLIAQACSAFEKATPGVRIFLRTVSAAELASPEAVLPDVALYETGSINFPEKVFLPLAGETESSGMFASASYAAPLWLSPNVLSLPAEWFAEEIATPRPDSLLAQSTAAPQRDARTALTPQELPWNRLLEPGAIAPVAGVALPQLLSMCPYAQRAALPAVFQAQTLSACAQVRPLGEHLSAVRRGESAAGCILTPAASDRVRYASLCRESEEARAFVQFLRTHTAQEALSQGLIPLADCPASADPLVQQAVALFAATHTLPNAFAHTRQELETICRQDFERLTDPVETLLHLR